MSWHHWWLVILSVLSVAGLYLLYVVATSYLDTKAAPRKPMIWCQRHGPILEQYAIDFMGEKVCSICFHEKFKAAENAGKR